jgi:hypothetical protein
MGRQNQRLSVAGQPGEPRRAASASRRLGRRRLAREPHTSAVGLRGSLARHMGDITRAGGSSFRFRRTGREWHDVATTELLMRGGRGSTDSFRPLHSDTCSGAWL